MMLKLSEYHRPRTVAEALDFLRRPGVPTLPLAGGTELLGRKDFTTQALVDLSTLGLDGLDTDEAGGLHIGAMVRLQTLVEDSRVRNFAGGVLSEAGRRGPPVPFATGPPWEGRWRENGAAPSCRPCLWPWEPGSTWWGPVPWSWRWTTFSSGNPASCPAVSSPR